jgi:hypothetical protein
MERELQTTKHIRALMFVRDPVETSAIVKLARENTMAAMEKMAHALATEELTVDEMAKIAMVAGKIAVDHTKIINEIRESLDDDAGVRLMMEQIDVLEKAHKRLLEGSNEVMEAQWTAGNRPIEPAGQGDETSGSADVVFPGGEG